MRSLVFPVGILAVVVGWVGLIFDSLIPMSDFGAGSFSASHLVVLAGVVLLIAGYVRLRLK